MNGSRRCAKCDAELAADAPGGFCPACLLREGMDSENATIPPNPTPASSALDDWQIAPAPGDLARHFPQLEIQSLLGQGGMGAVYKARQPKLNRLVALKILPPRFGRDPTFAERFVREAQALAKLNHPNIITVYDFGEEDGLYYFLMEYVDGVNLREALAAGSLSPENALAIVPQVCDALQFAHDEGVVHRDIKPENVLLDSKGRVKIADFGLAKLFGSSEERRLTISHQVMGTMHYMAPEQVENPVAVDHRADIYSLGVVLYELLTGELPLGRFDLPSQKAPVNTDLDDVVLRTLEKEPDRRYQHVSEVKTAVQRISEGGGGNAPAAPVAFQAGQPVASVAAAQGTTPHYGQIVMGIVMGGLGVVLFAFSGFSPQHLFVWLGLGFVLGGGGCLSMAWHEDARIPKSARPEMSALIMGGVMLLLGVSMLGYLGIYHGMDFRNVIFWIGIGMTLGGGGSISGAWSKAVTEHQMMVTQMHVDNMKPTDFDAVCDRLRWPAVGLLVAAASELWPALFFAYPLVKPYLPGGSDGNPVVAVMMWAGIGTLIGGAVALVYVTAAVAMMRARVKGWITFAAILALIPFHPGYLLSLPAGIWVLSVLNNKDVDAAFAYAKSET